MKSNKRKKLKKMRLNKKTGNRVKEQIMRKVKRNLDLEIL